MNQDALELAAPDPLGWRWALPIETRPVVKA